MAKMRVYELAKQLDVTSKDIIGFLAENGIEVKSQSGIEGETMALVEKKFKKEGAQTATEKPADAKKAAEAKKTAEVEKHAESKKTAETEKPADSQKTTESEKPADSKKTAESEKPAEEKPARAAKKPAAQAEGGKKEGRAAEKPEGARERRPKKKASITAVFNAQYSKQPRSRRPGEAPRRRSGERQDASRPQGRITVRPESERTVRPSHRIREEQERREQQRSAQNAAERPSRRIRPREMDPSERPSSRASRDAGENRRSEGRAERPARNMDNGRGQKNAFGNDKRTPAADSRGKDSRDRGGRKKQHDYESSGTRKQERYVNLEKNGGRKKTRPQQPKQERSADEILTLTLPEHITIKDLADKMKVQASAVVKKLFMKGVMVTVNQDIDYEQAEEIALEFNCICEPEEKVDVIAELLKEEEESADEMVARPPVVCVMGHVDHGKTSLLDAIRDTKVTDREAGGITQHIGAYMVKVNGQKITFLDTPGHEAFTAMRMRGANSTDIAILVVAADDGVMPQTVEAINHAKAAGIEIIVAINKIDKPNANVERVKQELSEYELIPEDWGGSTVFVPVSAHTHEGIDTLLEMILLTAEVLELKANPKRRARGLVIEAQLDKGRGVVATVLVQKGTLRVGDPIAAGSSYGKVRAMIDENGKRVKEAKPSTPVEILGLSDVPNAGEIFVVQETEKEARSFAETFISEGKNKLIEETKSKMSLDDLFSQIQSGNVKELNLIVKADVQGSVEAVRQSLVKLSNEEVVVKIIHGGVGAINESDVILASASNAIIIGFNVRPDAMAKATAEREGVDVRLYKVIYKAIEDIEASMKGLLDPIYEEQVIGHAQVRQVFRASDVGNIAGSYVLDGYFQRGCKVRVRRGEELLHEGELASLKRFKDDVKEVKAGYECGLVVEGFQDVQEEDIIEAYMMVEVPR